MPRFAGIPVEQQKAPRFAGQPVADFSGVTATSEQVAGQPQPVRTRTAELVEQGAIPASWQIPVEAAEQGLRAARQGVSLGFSDELAGLGAGAKALFTGESVGDAYTRARDLERARLRQFSETNPEASTLGQVGGGLLTSVVPVGRAAQAPSLLSQLARTTGTGIATGGVAGLGAGEGGVEQQLASTGKGALIGGVAAPVATGLAAGASRVARIPAVESGLARLSRLFGREPNVQTFNVPVEPGIAARTGAVPGEVPVRVQARDKALELVGETVRRSGVTPQQIEQQLVLNETLGAKPEVLADFLGDQGARRLYSARTLGAEGATQATERLAARGEGTAARVSEDVQRATGQRGQSLNQLDAKVENRRRLGNTLYQRAFEHGPVTSEETLALVQNPRVAGILKRASDRRAQVADLKGETYAPLFRDGPDGPVLARAPTVEDLHLLKTSLDDDIRQAYQQGEGQLGNALRDFKNRIVKNLEDEVPAYRKARETYKGDIEIEEAINNGRQDILRKPVDELRRDFATLSDAEKDAYRSGAIDTILARKVDPKVDSADFARSLWGNADSRNRLQLLVKNEDELVRLARQFEREQRIARTNRNVLGGSQTAMRQSDIEDQLAGTLADVATSGPQGAFVNTVQRWIRRAGGLTEPVADDVAKLLTAESPETIRAVLQALNGREQLRVMQALRRQQAGTAVGATTAQQNTETP